MNRGGSIENKSSKLIWGASLLLLCLLSCMLRTSYPNDMVFQDTCYFRSMLTLINSMWIEAECDTWINEGASYDTAATDATLTLPVGPPKHFSVTSYCTPLNGGDSQYDDEYASYGTWSLNSTHYLGQGSCDLFAAGTTSASLNFATPTINYFYSSPTHYSLPGSTTLYWSTTNA